MIVRLTSATAWEGHVQGKASAALAEVRLVLSLPGSSHDMRDRAVVKAMIERGQALTTSLERGTPAAWTQLVAASRRLRNEIKSAERPRRPPRPGATPAPDAQEPQGQ